jgi:hypothetical protein
MNKRKVADLEFGLRNEKKVLAYLHSKGQKFKKFPNPYSTLDFKYGDTVAELKSRTCTHNEYNTVMFGANKMMDILRGKYGNKRFVFYFLYTDGLYEWEYNPNVKDWFIAIGGRKDRGKDETGPVCHIHKSKLQLIESNISSIVDNNFL